MQHCRKSAGWPVRSSNGWKKEYPDAGCTLDYDDAWKLLVSVRLAAQCTDARVNVVVEKLYEKFPDVEALAAADPERLRNWCVRADLEKVRRGISVLVCGCPRDEYGGKVPDDFHALLKLPGVGRKSANLIMGDVFGKPAIVTDTHCIRLTNRMGAGRRNKGSEESRDAALGYHSSGKGQ